MLIAKTKYGAYDNGWEAFLAGHARASCPHLAADEILHQSWLNGWDDAAAHTSLMASTNKLPN